MSLLSDALNALSALQPELAGLSLHDTREGAVAAALSLAQAPSSLLNARRAPHSSREGKAFVWQQGEAWWAAPSPRLPREQGLDYLEVKDSGRCVARLFASGPHCVEEDYQQGRLHTLD